jgi:hypothetical protein
LRAKIEESMKTDGVFCEELKFLMSKKENQWKSNNPFSDYLHMSEMVNKRGSKTNRYERHLQPFKDFCTYLYLKCGDSAYQGLRLNTAMPSADTCKNNINETERMEIGKLYLSKVFDEMTEINATREPQNQCKSIIFAEDATRVSDLISYDPVSDEIYGLVAEYDILVGLPRKKFFKASSPSKLMNDLKNFKVAPYIQLIIAKPMILGSQPRVVGIFPTDNAYKSDIVVTRWKNIAQEVKKKGFNSYFSTDADPRLLNAMKILTKFGKSYYITGLCIPLLLDISVAIKTLSDPHHLLNNLKNRINDLTNCLMIGKFYVSMNYLKIMLNHPEISRNDHQLSNEDVGTFDSSKDKMNSNATRKICEPIVIELLKKIPGSEGTIIYLQMMRDLYDAFIEPTTTDLDRLKKAFKVLCFLRIWRVNVPVGERASFITNINWSCIEMNVSFLYQLVLEGKGNLIVIWNSQICEEYFRTLRSMGTYGLTQINFSVLEALQKINRVEKIIEICTKHKSTFNFPEVEKIRSDLSSLNITSSEKPTANECHRIIKQSLKEAKQICRKAGMECLEPCDPEKFFKQFHDDDDDEETLDDYLREVYGEADSEGELENADFDNPCLKKLSSGKLILKIKNMNFVEKVCGKNLKFGLIFCH